jgi:hypothetical protein
VLSGNKNNLGGTLWFTDSNGEIGSTNKGTFTFTPNQDINANSIPDTWERTYIGALSPANGDPDGDNLTNIQEYAFGTNPAKSNPSPLRYSFETKQGEQYLTMIVPRNPEATNITYSAEVSSDLTHWSPLLAETIDATRLRFQSLVPVSRADKQFFRAGVNTK